jgi:hypothetical protein
MFTDPPNAQDTKFAATAKKMIQCKTFFIAILPPPMLGYGNRCGQARIGRKLCSTSCSEMGGIGIDGDQCG